MPAQRGFTLIELMIVIVILGILASIAVVKSDKPRARAAVATMQSDLRNMAVAQEAYFADFQTFADDPSDLDMSLSNNVSMTVNADGTGWTARATHPLAPNEECAVVIGDIAPLAPASDHGVVRCQNNGGGGGGGGGNPGCNGN